MVPRNCESWEEEMYWKNFGFARFSLILPRDFHHRLMLPKKFTEHMRNQLPDKVVLKVNSLTWNMDLEKGKDDVVLHGNEWQEFAKAYSLKKSDMLIFQYNRHECFEVLLFDHANQCEKEASYFVKKGQHVQPNSHDNDDSSEEEFTDRNQGSRRRRNSSAAATGCFSDGNVSDEGGETSDEENSISADGFTTPKKASTKRAKEVPSNFSNKRNYKLAATPKEKRVRLVTNEEKKVALEKARKTSTLCLNSFFVVMRPTCVYKRFYMTIPQESRSMFCRGQKLILRVKEKAWVCTFTSSRHTGGLEGGWKRFALENSLEEYDVCLFAPSGAKDGRSVLDVSIFRAVPQVVQHSRPAIPDDETNEISIEDSSQGDDDSDSDSAQRKRHIKNSGGNAHTRGVDLSDEDESDESSDEETSSTTPEEAATLRSREVPSNSSKKRKHRIAAATTPKENGTYRKSSAGRTSIKEANKEQVLKMAHETADKYKNSFISVMKPSSVTKCYFMSITKEWEFRDTLMNGQEVILRLKKDKEKTWTCIFCSTSSNVGLQTGWKNFAIDNKLRESDVCLFVPLQENNRISTLDVLIFRVRAEH